MCGIVGVSAFGKVENEKARQEAMIFLSTKLLELSVERGKEAAGISTLFEDGMYTLLKMGVSPKEFVYRFGGEKGKYDHYLETWRNYGTPAKVVIGHCRKPSLGTLATPRDNRNNHPIRVGEIIGVHNGTLKNDDAIIDALNCKRDGDVDSEAIFRLLNHLTNDGKDPFHMAMLKEAGRLINGSFAVLAFNGNNPYQLAALREDRPIEIGVVRPLKLILFASEKAFLQDAVLEYNQLAHLMSGGNYLKLCKGDFDTGFTYNSSAMLFDLTKDIKADTKISELFEEARISRVVPVVDKKPADAKSSNPAAESSTDGVATVVDDKTKPENKSTPAKEFKKTNSALALVWNAGKYTAVSEEQIKYGEKLGGLEMNAEKPKDEPTAGPAPKETGAKLEKNGEGSKPEEGKVESVKSEEPGETHKESVTEVDGNKVAECQEASAKATGKAEGPVVEIIKRTEKDGELVVETKKYFTGSETPAIEIVKRKEADKEPTVKTNALAAVSITEVDGKQVSEDPDILKKAAAAAGKTVVLDGDNALKDHLGLTSLDMLYNMTRYAIANKCTRAARQDAYYEGYMDCKSEFSDNPETMSQLLIKARAKNRAAEAKIKALKGVVVLLARLGGDAFRNLFGDIGNSLLNSGIEGDAVSRCLKDTVKERPWLTLRVLRSLFKKEVEEYPLLVAVEAELKKLEGTDEKKNDTVALGEDGQQQETR